MTTEPNPTTTSESPVTILADRLDLMSAISHNIATELRVIAHLAILELEHPELYADIAARRDRVAESISKLGNVSHSLFEGVLS